MFVYTRTNPGKSVLEGLVRCLSFGGADLVHCTNLGRLLREKQRMVFQLFVTKLTYYDMYLNNRTMLLEVTLETLFFVVGDFFFLSGRNQGLMTTLCSRESSAETCEVKEMFRIRSRNRSVQPK